jgi:hypothetical protein
MGTKQPASKDTPILDHVIRNMLGELAAEGGLPVYTLTPARRATSCCGSSPAPSASQMFKSRIGTCNRASMPCVFAPFVQTLRQVVAR